LDSPQGPCRILAGEQGMTVNLPIRPEAQIAPQLSVALLAGEQPALDQLVARDCQRACLRS
jgi:ABC-type xylose transport system substrate-binding protein